MTSSWRLFVLLAEQRHGDYRHQCHPAAASSLRRRREAPDLHNIMLRHGQHGPLVSELAGRRIGRTSG